MSNLPVVAHLLPIDNFSRVGRTLLSVAFDFDVDAYLETDDSLLNSKRKSVLTPRESDLRPPSCVFSSARRSPKKEQRALVIGNAARLATGKNSLCLSATFYEITVSVNVNVASRLS